VQRSLERVANPEAALLGDLIAGEVPDLVVAALDAVPHHAVVGLGGARDAVSGRRPPWRTRSWATSSHAEVLGAKQKECDGGDDGEGPAVTEPQTEASLAQGVDGPRVVGAEVDGAAQGADGALVVAEAR
jgi:hypothetical protein